MEFTQTIGAVVTSIAIATVAAAGSSSMAFQKNAHLIENSMFQVSQNPDLNMAERQAQVMKVCGETHAVADAQKVGHSFDCQSLFSQ